MTHLTKRIGMISYLSPLGTTILDDRGLNKATRDAISLAPGGEVRDTDCSA